MAEWSSRCWQGDIAHHYIVQKTLLSSSDRAMHDVQGANTPFIMKSRGLSRAVPMSEMLERNPQIKHLMEAGELVPDVSHMPTWLYSRYTGSMCIHHAVFLVVTMALLKVFGMHQSRRAACQQLK